MAYKESNDAGSIKTGILVYARGGTGLGTLGTAGQVLAVNAGVTALEFKTISGTVSSVSGTTDKITVSGTANDPILTIASTYAGQSSISTLGTITAGIWNGTAIPVGYGGTGQATQQLALNALAGAVTVRYFLRGDGTNVTMSAIQAADIPTLNQSTSGTAANVTGIVAFANGGTGQNTQQLALNAIGAAVTSGYYLRGNGTNIVMSAIVAGDVPTLNQSTTGSSAYSTTVPQNAQTSAYVLTATDTGKHIAITTGGVTLNTSVFTVGQVVTIFNNSSSSQQITQGASVTLRLAGGTSTGNRTLGPYGVCTILCVATNTFVLSGQGVS